MMVFMMTVFMMMVVMMMVEARDGSSVNCNTVWTKWMLFVYS